MVTRRTLPTLALALSLALASNAAAQDVTYRTKSTVSLGATMDRVMRVVGALGGGSMEVEETQYIKGRRTRTDTKESGSIVDLEKGRLVYLNHSDKTFSELTMDSLRAASQQMAQAMSGGGGPQASQQSSSSEYDYTFDVAVDRTGEKQKIAGYDAERVFITVTVDAHKKGAPASEPGPRFVVLNDVWNARGVPGQDQLAAINKEQAEAVGAAAKQMSAALSGAMTGEPGQQAAFARAAEEMKKVEGMPMRQTTYMVVGTTDKPFDRQATIATPAPKQGGGAAGAAANAARGALGGLMGRGRAAEPAPAPAPAPEPTQATVFKMTREVVEVKTSNISESTFDVPTSYKKAGG